MEKPKTQAEIQAEAKKKMDKERADKVAERKAARAKVNADAQKAKKQKLKDKGPPVEVVIYNGNNVVDRSNHKKLFTTNEMFKLIEEKTKDLNIADPALAIGRQFYFGNLETKLNLAQKPEPKKKAKKKK